MTHTPMPSSPSPRDPLRRWTLWLAIAAALLTAATAAGYYLYYPWQAGPAQPIPFSHRFHVSEKKLSCVFCHSGALDTPRAGVPPLETCMLCHQKIIVEYPAIRTLREHYERRRPLEWARVNDLPDLAFFNHAMHLRKGFDCGQCHGDVAGMDRVAYVEEFKMGFCIQCHRDENASHDCLTCHR